MSVYSVKGIIFILNRNSISLSFQAFKRVCRLTVWLKVLSSNHFSVIYSLFVDLKNSLRTLFDLFDYSHVGMGRDGN